MTYQLLLLCPKCVLILEGGYNIVESCFSLRWCLETLLTHKTNYIENKNIKLHEWARNDIQNTLNCI